MKKSQQEPGFSLGVDKNSDLLFCQLFLHSLTFSNNCVISNDPANFERANSTNLYSPTAHQQPRAPQFGCSRLRPVGPASSWAAGGNFLRKKKKVTQSCGFEAARAG
ncbi:hypothetical protein NE619_01855 [Anaerovorax odorimutans]|uniref:Uncharacterized protein n=1 Tax=Anaerovorax odorimutans TaxID=109327 RepID=A0ABT1RJV3_9FIRM|nr:hypothetical protein [Anaerovorax odorimutans]